jgi:phage terminase large subunit
MPLMQTTPKLLPLIQKPKRFKIIIGGRGSGKSQGVGDIALMEVQTKQVRAACFREFQNSIEDSVYALLKEEIDRLELDGFTLTNNSIEHCDGGLFRFKGLARNPDSIKSMFGFRRFLVEEAQSLSEDSIKLLTPTMREADGEVWFIGNPMSSADPFSKRFIVPFKDHLDKYGYYEDELHLILKVNWRDNPWFPDELNQERLWDYANLSRAAYDHIWEGEFNDSVENSIILPEWFDACVDAHITLGFEPLGQEVVSYDPADSGDAKAIAYMHGSVIKDVRSKEDGAIDTATDWACAYANNVKADVFTWDADGMGMGLKRQLADAFSGKKVHIEAFRGSEAADKPDAIYEPLQDKDAQINKAKTNKETFLNCRAQYYWRLRDRMYRTYLVIERGMKSYNPDELISISSDIGELSALRSEICRIPRKEGPRIQILSKPEMKKLKIKSPNMADAVMMLQRPVLVQTKREPIPYPKNKVA